MGLSSTPTRCWSRYATGLTERVERLLLRLRCAGAEASRLNPRLVQYRFVTGPAEASPYARQLAADLADIGSGVVSVRPPKAARTGNGRDADHWRPGRTGLVRV